MTGLMANRFLIFLLVVGLAIGLASRTFSAPLPAAAAVTADRVVTEHAQSTLLAARDGFEPGEATWFAFEQDLEPGWHVYWRNPGDSGLPLDFQWDLPEGYIAGEIVYPTPERIPVGPLANFGHHGNPIFLVPVTAPADAVLGADVPMKLTATWLICEEICVPETGEFELRLPVSDAPNEISPGARLIAGARADAPKPLDGDVAYFVSGERVVLQADGIGQALEAALFFPELEGLIEPSAPQEIIRDGDQLFVSMATGFAFEPDVVSPMGGVLVLTSQGERKGFTLSAPRVEPPKGFVASGSSAPAAPVGAYGGGNLAVLFVAAFLGGLILNVMPCVFPIIFIKAASLIHSAQSDRGAVRRHGLLYTGGVVAMFVALGGALLALRAGGAQLGWGFHLQSPVVVVLSAYILLLVGLNLAGVFNVGESLQGVGGGLASKSGNAGAFFTGVLAVLVAAPCIGPLLSAPMAATVVLPPTVGMLIFVVMALGLAAPYLVLSISPALGRFLPKPGAWMKIFKQALAFPVFAAAAYFLWVLAQQTSAGGLAKAFSGAILLSLAVWLFELSKGEGARAVIVRAAAGIAALGAILPIVGLEIAAASTAEPKNYGRIESVKFDETEIDRLRTEGRAVFVDFTAAWCVTCQLNKLTVLSRRSVADALADNDVVFMVADWTARDPEITAALEKLGANGVPLYVFYPPQGAPTILPLPLTEASLIKTVSGPFNEEASLAEKF